MKMPARTKIVSDASGKSERGDLTREKLLAAAVDVFGRHGFEGTSTRALADAAGANLQAIHYYFGDKKGLYLAAADHIVGLIKAHNADMAARVSARLAAPEVKAEPLSAAEASAMLTDIMQTLAQLYVSRQSESWARFMMREQMEPTEAFARLYNGLMKPGMETMGQLLAIILDEPPGCERIRLLTLSLLGSILMHRMGNATAMAHLGWKRVGSPEMESIRTHAAELVANITATTASKC